MSVVVAAIFPDFGMLMSDSRVTINGNSKRDELQKIYQLSNHLAVGFTSNNVRISCQIISEMTKYSLKNTRSQHPLYLLEKLPRVANFYYKKLTKGLSVLPAMDFSYIGILNDRGSSIPIKPVFDLMKRFNSSFNLSPEMQRGLFSAKDGFMNFQPPIPIALIQKFPFNDIKTFNTLGISLCGSGSVAFIKLEKDLEKTLLAPEKIMRIVIIQSSVEDYCKENGIDTVGGLSQIVIIDKNGVKPQGYSANLVMKDGKIVGGKKMEYRDEGWVQIDLRTGIELKIRHNPLIIDTDNKFTALQSAFC